MVSNEEKAVDSPLSLMVPSVITDVTTVEYVIVLLLPSVDSESVLIIVFPGEDSEVVWLLLAMPEDEEDDERQSLVVFGRDIAKIPCFRSSILYGLGGGVSGGLVCFLMTSRPQFSSRIGMLCLVAVTVGYWTRCRYEYSKNRQLHHQLEAAARRKALLQGTEEEKRILDFKDA
ncbi:unnamed protein product [Notodromas monacha]|uniref:Cytochrome c oxidase assembly protein COX20, mitochondrial n=1 Tax=Notodromas monacha TaxID=399045 RepID=A0A7R9GC06_9CRUS|nr:unnamed protein product [Notodromas monacha]CAG0915502.1 unnamed protein product [Notodromas monacha]